VGAGPGCAKALTVYQTKANDRAGPSDAAEPPATGLAGMPDVVDQVALARLYGEPLFRHADRPLHPARRPGDLSQAFEGPLDLLLYLIRRQNFTFWTFPWRA